MSARDIALSAYAQAVAAEEERLAQAERDKAEVQRLKDERHKETFERALVILESWFPGVKWGYETGGDFDADTLVFDADEEQYPPSFRLLIRPIGRKGEGRVEFEVGDYVVDHMSGGYSFFHGTPIRSPADLGRHLKSKENLHEKN